MKSVAPVSPGASVTTSQLEPMSASLGIGLSSGAVNGSIGTLGRDPIVIWRGLINGVILLRLLATVGPYPVIDLGVEFLESTSKL